MALENLQFEAEKRGDKKEANRLKRLIERIEEIKIQYGKQQREKYSFRFGDYRAEE